MDVKINKDWFEALSSSMAPVPGGGAELPPSPELAELPFA